MMLIKTLSQIWKNSNFHTKLSIILITGVLLPTVPITEGILKIAEYNLIKNQQDSLEVGLENFQQQMEWVEDSYIYIAEVIQKSVESAKINLSKPTQASQQNFLQSLTDSSTNTKFTPSFLLRTDIHGQVLDQNIKVIPVSKVTDNLPSSNTKPLAIRYQQITPNIGSNLSELPIVKTSLREHRTISGIELINSKLLQNLGLATQANIGYRPQKTENLPESKKPFPLLTYDTNGGRIGLAIIAVQPIKINNHLVGLAIAGQLLNRNYQLVDTIPRLSKISTATIFAYDWRISTNVANYDGKTRAIGTRVSREVAEAVLNQRKRFIGSANIIGQAYRTAYAPIYGQKPEPIGIYAIAEPEINIQKTLRSLEITYYCISGGILFLSILLILPIASSLSRSIQRLTDFAQLIGKGEQGMRLAENHRQDEIGILEYELNRMAIRIENNLEKIMTKEIQIRQQAKELEQALDQLKQTQAQLVANAKMSSLQQLVAGIAHEINNPVNFIYANTQYAETYLKDLIKLIKLYQFYCDESIEEIADMKAEIDWEFLQVDLPNLLQSMKSGAERIKKIVLLLRTFSRMDEAEYKLVNLHDGLDSILELLKYRLQSRNHHPKIEIIKEYGELPLVTCYAGELNQVFLSIITNAIDAIEEIYQYPNFPTNLEKIAQFSPWIRISTEQINHDHVLIRIADNASGIPENLKNHLFNPFFTTKPVGQGFGLGLAISYQVITKQHRGIIKCNSTEGKGTEFEITIPLSVISNMSTDSPG